MFDGNIIFWKCIFEILLDTTSWDIYYSQLVCIPLICARLCLEDLTRLCDNSRTGPNISLRALTAFLCIFPLILTNLLLTLGYLIQAFRLKKIGLRFKLWEVSFDIINQKLSGNEPRASSTSSKTPSTTSFSKSSVISLTSSVCVYSFVFHMIQQISILNVTVN